MFDPVSLEKLEQQAAQLPLHEQLVLIAHISARLSQTAQELLSVQEHQRLQLQPEQEATHPPGFLYPTRPQPSESLARLIGLVAVGGDALAESEALYDAD